jgi:hypothetical protein
MSSLASSASEVKQTEPVDPPASTVHVTEVHVANETIPESQTETQLWEECFGPDSAQTVMRTTLNPDGLHGNTRVSKSITKSIRTRNSRRATQQVVSSRAIHAD